VAQRGQWRWYAQAQKALPLPWSRGRGRAGVIVCEDRMGAGRAVTMDCEDMDRETGGPNNGGLNGSIWDLVEKQEGPSRAFRMGNGCA
jgi:hypothetical protein